jgi:cell division protein FtsI/penicillin-binding protein 2
VVVIPIELINAVSAIANGGKLMKPYITNNEKPEVIRQVISSDTAKKVTEMMVSAVKVNVIADIPNYSVAAKTGTAFLPNFKTGGYTEDVINSYVGFAPAFDPKFIILIKMDKPAGGINAGRSVVPAFRKFAEFLLNYYQIAPDKLVDSQ